MARLLGYEVSVVGTDRWMNNIQFRRTEKEQAKAKARALSRQHPNARVTVYRVDEDDTQEILVEYKAGTPTYQSNEYRNPSWSIARGVTPHPVVGAALGVGVSLLAMKLIHDRHRYLRDQTDIWLRQKHFGPAAIPPPGHDGTVVFQVKPDPYVNTGLTPQQLAYQNDIAPIQTEQRVLSIVGHPASIVVLGAAVGGAPGAAAVVALDLYLTMRAMQGMFG